MGRLARRALPLTGVGLLLLTACSRKAPNALDPQGPAAKSVSSVAYLMFGMATVVYIIVAALIIIGALRGKKESRISDNAFIIIGGLIVPSVILAGLAIVTVKTTDTLRKPAADALKIEVTGYQFWWGVKYPDAKITTANEIRVPAGRPVEMTLLSQDVIHSFWVPQLAGKVDMIPGQSNVIRFTADKPGEYRGQCAEFCGLQHAKMAMLVVAEPPGDYERWVTRQQRPRGGPATEREAAGEQVFMRSSCAGCHTVRDTEAQGTKGPDLSDFGGRKTLGALSVENNRANLAGWIENSQSIKPGNLMPAVQLEPDELLNLLDYLENLR